MQILVMKMAIESIEAVEAYRGNQLIEACGPILSPTEITQNLANIPSFPEQVQSIPFHVRKHNVASIWGLYMPTLEGVRLAETLDLMIRQGYARCRPGTPDFWKKLYKDQNPILKPISAAVVGISGVGKSVAIENALRIYPQCVDHEKFSGFASPFRQLIWLKVDAPESGKLVDLAANLMLALGAAVGTNEFEDELHRRNKRGPDMFRSWLKIAAKYALGLLVVDEIQNLFKQAPIKARRSNQSNRYSRLELRIIEDEALKHILTAQNTWGIPIVVAGTPDGVESFNTRMSTIQRLMTCGFHKFQHISNPDDRTYSQSIFPVLSKYQWVSRKLPPSQEFAGLVHKLSGGVPRIYTALWVAAHRYAFDGNRDELTFKDFEAGFHYYLQPLAPAVEALLSNDPIKLARYEDALPKDPAFWSLLT